MQQKLRQHCKPTIFQLKKIKENIPPPQKKKKESIETTDGLDVG